MPVIVVRSRKANIHCDNSPSTKVHFRRARVVDRVARKRSRCSKPAQRRHNVVQWHKRANAGKLGRVHVVADFILSDTAKFTGQGVIGLRAYQRRYKQSGYQSELTHLKLPIYLRLPSHHTM